jgi:centromeric protein E
MKDVFSYIRRTPSREYLLRCSYLEIYNETIHDLLSPYTLSTTSSNAPSGFSYTSQSQPQSNQGVQIQGIGANIILTPLREEVVTSLKGVKEVLERGYGNRRTASTDWNERSSRSHSVFRLVIESRERETGGGGLSIGDIPQGGRVTPNGRGTPGGAPPTPGGARLQARGGRSVQTSVLASVVCVVRGGRFAYDFFCSRRV